jgi:hypothetical protein
VFNEASAAARAFSSVFTRADNEPSAAVARDSSASTSAMRAVISAAKLFAKDTSEDIARDPSAFKEVSNDKSPATLEDASAVTAFVLPTISVDKLAATDWSPASLVDASDKTAFVLLTTSEDKLDATELSPATLEDASFEMLVDKLPNSVSTFDVKPNLMSPAIIPTGVVIDGLDNIKSDCKSKTILVVDIKIYF